MSEACRRSAQHALAQDPTIGVHHREGSVVADRADIAEVIGQPFELERITVPLLLVWGDRDRLVFHRGAKRVLEAVPGSRLELLPGVGHCPQIEAPAAVTDLLLEFSGELDLAAA